MAVVNGRDVNDDVVVTAGQVLTFMHRAGEKGAGREAHATEPSPRWPANGIGPGRS
jgi:hypothetical protein